VHHHVLYVARLCRFGEYSLHEYQVLLALYVGPILLVLLGHAAYKYLILRTCDTNVKQNREIFSYGKGYTKLCNTEYEIITSLLPDQGIGPYVHQ